MHFFAAAAKLFSIKLESKMLSLFNHGFLYKSSILPNTCILTYLFAAKCRTRYQAGILRFLTVIQGIFKNRRLSWDFLPEFHLI